MEYKSYGIRVQSVCAFHVATKLVKFGNENVPEVKEAFFSPYPETYVKSAIRTVGSQMITNGCFAHSVQVSWCNLKKSNYFF